MPESADIQYEKTEIMKNILNILHIDLVYQFKNIREQVVHTQDRKEKQIYRWMNEKWTKQRGEIGYKYKSDSFRPTVKISKETPTTFNELANKQIERARKEKANTGRVNKFLTN